MTRRPRKPDEHLVTARLLAHAYGQMGEIATAGGFFTYFVVMRLYGFPPSLLFGLVSRQSIIPEVDGKQDWNYNTAYTYDALATNLGCPAFPYPCNPSNLQTGFPDWLSTLNSRLDVRGLYSNCVNGHYTPQL